MIDWDSITNEILSLVVDKQVPVVLAVDQIWKERAIPFDIYIEIKSQSIRSMNEILGASIVKEAGGVQNAYNRLFNDQELRDTASKTSARMRIDVTKQMQLAIAEGQSIQVFATNLRNLAFSAGADTKGAIEKGLKQLYNSPLKEQVKVINRRIKAGISNDQLRQSYEDLVKASKDPQNVVKIAKQQQYALNAKLKSRAEHIYNTEQSRAINAAKSEKIAQDPDVKYVKIILESRKHHVSDICDAVTSANPTGKGKGVYELSKAPLLPLHPNCACRMYPVYIEPTGTKPSSIEDIAKKEKIKIYSDVQYQNIRTKL